MLLRQTLVLLLYLAAGVVYTLHPLLATTSTSTGMAASVEGLPVADATTDSLISMDSALDHDKDSRGESRVEPIPRPNFPHHLYPMWIGHKFEPDGRLLPFPGNTIICHLSPDSELYRACVGLHKALQEQEFSSLYVLLPPESWHMTVFEGVSDRIRKHSSWPADLPLDGTLDECTALVREKLSHFDLGTEPPFHLAVDGFDPLTEGIALKVVPASLAEEGSIRDLRDRLSDLLQMRHPGHKTYSFHISLAYLLCHLDEEQHRKLSDLLQAYRSKLPDHFDLGAPEFCIFGDMFAFHRQLLLHNAAIAE